ncbi:hypothetical protein HT136_01475 [Novosphingobium profundi]|uniref:hypothetical protein n=1 Tax=Novosphingobium profundi TaxID=1774954 RepID=UPI001BD9B72A|nr:hypothetical protein [Novosphingobium profundi]MBT0667037.1 hypothetical protein [Novosphingobium profundi]
MSVAVILALFKALGAKLLNVLVKYPWQIALALAALYAWREHRSAVSWQGKASAEVAAHQKTKADYQAAQVEATAKAKAAREAWESKSERLAKEADDANEQADGWRARAQRFADVGGLRAQPGTCSGSAASGAAASTQADTAQGGDRSGPAPVVLSRSDFDILTGNTERLLKVHAWGEQLIEAGMAAQVVTVSTDGH